MILTAVAEGFRPLAGIRGIRRREAASITRSGPPVSVPLRGLGVFGVVETVEVTRVVPFVSVPLRGLGVFGVLLVGGGRNSGMKFPSPCGD